VLIDADSAPAIARLAGASDATDLPALETALASWTKTVDLDEAGDALRSRGIEAVRIHDGLSIARDPYFRARGDVVPAPRPGAPELMVPGHIPRRAGKSRLRAFRPAGVGENNAEVFGEAVDEADR
jgi:crotonobetainyl-CoA:carnitine CoA-transferase CaiB-like acyl-CoA transferase